MINIWSNTIKNDRSAILPYVFNILLPFWNQTWLLVLISPLPRRIK